MRQKHLIYNFSIFFVFFPIFLFLTGCEGPVEQAGKEIDETVEQQREKLQKTEDEVKKLREELAQAREEYRKAGEELAVARQERQQALDKIQNDLNNGATVPEDKQEQAGKIPRENRESQVQ
jgi:septal ring factor EnvC (AmiA/AmiB activator)